MSIANAKVLRELIQLASDSGNLYRHAADVVELPELQLDFTVLALAKEDLVGVLGKELALEGGHEEVGGSVGGAVRSAFTRALAALSQRPAARFTYAAELESIEQHLLTELDQATVAVDSERLRAALLAEMPRLRSSRAQIALLKDDLA
jgi:uncharacterized protein (TIGR02284 family)